VAIAIDQALVVAALGLLINGATVYRGVLPSEHDLVQVTIEVCQNDERDLGARATPRRRATEFSQCYWYDV
jgi:hypothetical protein